MRKSLSSAFLAAVLGGCATPGGHMAAASVTPSGFEDPAVGSPPTRSASEYLDDEAKELEHIALARRTRTGISIDLDSRLFVSAESTILTPVAVEQLAELGDVLAKFSEGHVHIEGHVDGTGSEAHDEEISLRRAISVRDVLATRGVSRTRMFVDGVGATEPVADSSTPEGRAKNSRIEIRVYRPDHGLVAELLQR